MSQTTLKAKQIASIKVGGEASERASEQPAMQVLERHHANLHNPAARNGYWIKLLEQKLCLLQSQLTRRLSVIKSLMSDCVCVPREIELLYFSTASA
jgi:hypothetical protein